MPVISRFSASKLPNYSVENIHNNTKGDSLVWFSQNIIFTLFHNGIQTSEILYQGKTLYTNNELFTVV